MSSKKILFSISYYSPYVSGLTNCAQRVADNLARDQKVSILCMQHYPSLPLREKNIFRARPLFKIGKGFISWDFIVKSWLLVSQNDVLVINLPEFEGFIPAIFAGILGKKTISLVHCEVTLKNKILQIILDLANLMSLILSDTIIVYTLDYAKHARLLKYFLSKTIEIYPPVPFTPSVKSIKFAGQLKLGIAARLAEEKGVEYLLEAIPIIQKSINKKVMLYIAGPIDPVGEQKYKNKILNLIADLKDQVVFLGSLSQEQLASLYEAIDILVLPSVNSTEAFGLVQVEAMQHGTPVVASNLPGVRIPISLTGMGELTIPKDPNSLADAIIKVSRTHYKNNADKIFSIHDSYAKYRSVILS